MPSRPRSGQKTTTRRKRSIYSRTRCDSDDAEFDAHGSDEERRPETPSRTSLLGGMMCMISGILLTAGSLAMTAIGYFAVELSLTTATTTTTTTTPTAATELPAVSETASPIAAQPSTNGGIDGAFLDAFQMAGPVLMGTGFFIIICASVVVKEAICPTPPTDEEKKADDDDLASSTCQCSQLAMRAKVTETSSYTEDPGWYRNRTSSSIRRRFRRSHSDEGVNYARGDDDDSDDDEFAGEAPRRVRLYRPTFPPSPKVVVHRSFTPETSSDGSENEGLLGATAAAAESRERRRKTVSPTQSRKLEPCDPDMTETLATQRVESVKPKGFVDENGGEKELTVDPPSKKGLEDPDGGISRAHNTRHSRLDRAADERDARSAGVVTGVEPDFNQIAVLTPSDSAASGDSENQLHYHSLTALASVEANQGKSADGERIEMRRLTPRDKPTDAAAGGTNGGKNCKATTPSLPPPSPNDAPKPKSPSLPHQKAIFIKKTPPFDGKDYGEVSQV